MNTKQVSRLIGKTEKETVALARRGVLGAVKPFGWHGSSRIAVVYYNENKVANYLGITKDELLKRLEALNE